jgi:hypothetical protein
MSVIQIDHEGQDAIASSIAEEGDHKKTVRFKRKSAMVMRKAFCSGATDTSPPQADSDKAPGETTTIEVSTEPTPHLSCSPHNKLSFITGRSETFEEAMKALHVRLDPETAFTPPADVALRTKHTERLRHALQHLQKDVDKRIKNIDKKGLPLRYPGREDYLRKVSAQLGNLDAKLKREAAYHCLANDTAGTPSSGPGNFCFHLLVREPEIVKDFIYDSFLLVRALDRYQMLDGVGAELFCPLETIFGLASRPRTHMAKIDLELEKQTLSFCEYQVDYAARSNISIVPNSAQAINNALRQARIADPDSKTDDVFKTLRGYVLQGVMQKRKMDHVVVDVIQRLEEDLAARHGGKVRIVV